MMDILMSETCCAYKKWNKIASDIKLVSYSSAVDIVICAPDDGWRNHPKHVAQFADKIKCV